MSTIPIDQLLETAIELQDANQLAEAEALYRRILDSHPNHPDALHLLGVIAGARKQFDSAIDLINRSLAAAPDNPDAHADLGNILQLTGQLVPAVESYRRALALDDQFVEAHFNLGRAYAALGELDQAIGCYQRAVALQPQLADAHYALANSFKAKNQFDRAIASYQMTLSIRPCHVDAINNLGVAHAQLNQFDQAISAFLNALSLRSDDVDAHNNLAAALRQKGQLPLAIEHYRRAVALRPDDPELLFRLAHALKDNHQLDPAIDTYRRAIALNDTFPEALYNLGLALAEKRDLDGAISSYRRALSAKPDMVVAHCNLGIALNEKGLIEQAIDCYRTAIALDPTYAEAHVNLGLALGRTGQFPHAWDEYQWRLKIPGYANAQPTFPQPVWDGTSRAGALLLTAEQGFGDTIQFVRYVPLVAHRCQRVMLRCPRELIPLLQGMQSITQLSPMDAPPPEFDVHFPLLSLPQLFATTLDTIPGPVPYLKADPAKSATWAEKLAGAKQFKIGLAWAGNPQHKNDRARSIHLNLFAPLAKIPMTSFFSLQKHRSAEFAAGSSPGIEMIDHTGDLHDFSDTAALIANLDLVIAVDTAIAHLAGAMARPVWTLLPFIPDWRWMMNRSDSPWYPTMRLFRQPAIGDWNTVITRVSRELQNRVPESHRQQP
jgi:tetratricopeptide (TPR) repeat protein